TTGYPGAYPLNIYGESPHTAMGDEISALWERDTGGDYVTVHSAVGESGQGISVIDKTAIPSADRGHAYAAALFEVRAIARLAAAAGKTYGVGAIVLTHGETDSTSPRYESAVYKLWEDANADIASITHQSTLIPLILTQQQTCPGEAGHPEAARSLIAEWRLGVDHPGEILCAGPKYQYPYASDHLHLVARGYDQLGEKYGEVYYEAVVLGHDWEPLEPRSATLTDREITVKFHVPVAPLAWDDALPAPHQAANVEWSKGRGFEVEGKSGPLVITKVAIDADSVVLTLASAPDRAGLVVRYAVTQDGTGNLGGLATGRIGQLRDSDPLIGVDTNARQYNYAVSFAMPVE
ncbi:MAG: dockerin, partial [Polyangiaceae bacterium]